MGVVRVKPKCTVGVTASVQLQGKSVDWNRVWKVGNTDRIACQV